MYLNVCVYRFVIIRRVSRSVILYFISILVSFSIDCYIHRVLPFYCCLFVLSFDRKRNEFKHLKNICYLYLYREKSFRSFYLLIN